MTGQSAPRRDIVVIEDDQPTLTGWMEVLRDAGYSVTGAATFEDGRRLLESQTPDLLITDVRLGAYNGLQLVIRARRHAPPIPAIVLTGFSDSVIREDAERLDAIYVEKPVDPKQFLHIVSEALTLRR